MDLNFIDAEMLSVRISTLKEVFKIYENHRPPSGNVGLLNEEMLEILRQSNNENNVVLVGDIYIIVVKIHNIIIISIYQYRYQYFKEGRFWLY